MHEEVVGAADAARVDDYFARGFVGHNMPLGLPPGRDGVKRFLEELRSGLDDLSITIDAVLADGDLVAVRSTIRGVHRGALMGIPATGRRLEIEGMDVVR